MQLERRRIYYSGRVQGVGFRATTQGLARPFGVAGYARNLPDGSVEVVAQAAAETLDLFLDSLLREMGDKIRNIEMERLEVDPDLGPGFEIRY